MHRRTVRQALAAAAPPVRKPRVLAAPKLDPAKPLIDAMLREDLTAHRKQQHTARRVLARLVDGHQMSEVSYASVRGLRGPPAAANPGRGRPDSRAGVCLADPRAWEAGRGRLQRRVVDVGG